MVIGSLLLFTSPVLSDSLLPRGLQHAWPPCPSLSPRVCPSSCSLHRWCHPAISSSDALFCPWSFPASGTLPVSRLCVRWPKYCSFSFSMEEGMTSHPVYLPRERHKLHKRPNRIIHSDNYLTCKWIKCTNQKTDWLDRWWEHVHVRTST